ncbi:MAG TPA: DEAD/DEAH box helicase [Longimicrobiales bacterium]
MRDIECVSPLEAAIRILCAIFPHEGSALEDGDASSGALSEFQRRGVARAISTIERHGGVIIADAVGLGKTHMGLAIARHFIAHDTPVVVVLPSALRRQWEVPLRRISGGVTVITHAALSRGRYRASLTGGQGLLLVDEAHAFRNPGTRRYGALARLAINRQVCLITATPVNNSLWDLYHLIRLFCTDDALTSVGVPDLKVAFGEAVAEGSGSAGLRAVLRALVIRRTRRDVAHEIGSGDPRFRFPALRPPVTIPYDPAGDGRHDEILRGIADLRLDAFGTDASALIRFLLLKRLASSSTALVATVHDLVQLQRERLAALHEGLLLTPADARIASGPVVDQLTMRRLVCVPIPPYMDVERLEADMRRDLEILADIERLTKGIPHDPKLGQLRRLLDGRLRGEKVLIFTEFRDTAEYLWRALLPRGGVGLIHGSDAFLGRGRAGRNAVVARFAPRANGGRRFPEREAVDILIATDVLAEGLNLQDCAHVVSYDLPWNPVRLIQRVGRIDRMGSPHAEVHSYNFVPDRALDAYLRLLRRLGIKLRAIDVTLGLEHIVVDPYDLDPGDWQHLITCRQLTDGYPHSHSVAPAGPGWSDESLRTWLRNNGPPQSDRPCIVVLTPAGGRAQDRANRSGERAVLVIQCSRTGQVSAFRADGSGWRGAHLRMADPITAAVECIEAGGEGVFHTGYDSRLTRRARVLFRIAVARATPQGARPLGVPASIPHPAAIRAARQIHAALSAIPGGPDRQEMDTAERLIIALGRSPPAAMELEIQKLGQRKGATFRQIISAATTILDRQSPRTHPARESLDGSSNWRLICAVFTTSAVDPPPDRR